MYAVECTYVLLLTWGIHGFIHMYTIMAERWSSSRLLYSDVCTVSHRTEFPTTVGHICQTANILLSQNVFIHILDSYMKNGVWTVHQGLREVYTELGTYNGVIKVAVVMFLVCVGILLYNRAYPPTSAGPTYNTYHTFDPTRMNKKTLQAIMAQVRIVR